jgi:amino-acid N-acetyltransferase
MPPEQNSTWENPVPIIRKPQIKDVPQIHGMLKDFSSRGLMLPRPLSELYDVIRAFHVASPEDDPDVVAGVCALHVCWSDLGEIRSLAVLPEYQGADLGRMLVRACMAEAKDLGLDRLFVLTYIPDFFEKLGFKLTEKAVLPQKIWADCLKCVKFPECDEIALERWI